MNTTTFAPPTGALDPQRARRRIDAAIAPLRRVGLALWRSLEAYGRAKALHELRQLHDRWALTNPTLAEQLRAGSAFMVAEGTRHDA